MRSSHDLTIDSGPFKWTAWWLRAEAAFVLLAALYGYYAVGGSWLWFVVLFLAPDLAMIGYAAGARIGAVAYNAVHVYAGPIIAAGIGAGRGDDDILKVALIWTAHIALDRVLGFGLKLTTSFGDTHLGLLGRRD